MIDFYENKVTRVACHERGFYATVGCEIGESGRLTAEIASKIEIIDEQYRPLQVKVTTESGKVIRVFDFSEIVEEGAIK